MEAIDYLLKPFDQDRFQKSLERAANRIVEKDRDRRQITRLMDIIKPRKSYLQRLVVRDGSRLFFVPVRDIQLVSAQENYVELHTGAGNHLIRETLNHLETRLDPQKFARIHRSEIVNIDAIKELQSWSHGDYMVNLKDGTQARLSRRYQRNLFGVPGLTTS